MKQLLVLSMPLLLSACFSLPDKPDQKDTKEIMKKLGASWETGQLYIDSKDTMKVTQFGAGEGPFEKNTSVRFYSLDSSMRTYTGNYINYLKDGSWQYDCGDSGPGIIIYSPYAIGKFIKTNLPERGTTSVIDTHTEKYRLTLNEDSITILFHADTLSARVKRRPYEDLMIEQMQNKGYKLSKTENKLLQDSSNTISITSLKFVKGTERIFYKTAYAVMKNGYLAYAMQYGLKIQTAAELLFDGVLTNLYMNEERFYYPFRKKENSTTMELDSTITE